MRNYLLLSSMTRDGTELKKVAHTEVVDREYCLSGSRSSLQLVHSRYGSKHVHMHRNQQNMTIQRHDPASESSSVVSHNLSLVVCTLCSRPGA